MSATSTWTDEQDNELKENWGKRSASVIGGIIGKSRCSVIGRAHRIGLKSLKPKSVWVKPAKELKRAKRRPSVQLPFPRPQIKPHDQFLDIPLPINPFNIPFMDRTPTQCVFPTQGEGHSMLVCGNETIGTNPPYCRWHYSIAYTRTDRKPKPYDLYESPHRKGVFTNSIWRAA